MDEFEDVRNLKPNNTFPPGSIDRSRANYVKRIADTASARSATPRVRRVWVPRLVITASIAAVAAIAVVVAFNLPRHSDPQAVTTPTSSTPVLTPPPTATPSPTPTTQQTPTPEPTESSTPDVPTTANEALTMAAGAAGVAAPAPAETWLHTTILDSGFSTWGAYPDGHIACGTSRSEANIAWPTFQRVDTYTILDETSEWLWQSDYSEDVEQFWGDPASLESARECVRNWSDEYRGTGTWGATQTAEYYAALPSDPDALRAHYEEFLANDGVEHGTPEAELVEQVFYDLTLGIAPPELRAAMFEVVATTGVTTLTNVDGARVTVELIDGIFGRTEWTIDTESGRVESGKVWARDDDSDGVVPADIPYKQWTVTYEYVTELP